MSAPIGLLGVGLVGSAIAQRLSTAGYRVAGFDPIPPKVGCVEMARSAAEVFQNCETLILSLPDAKAVRAVLTECAPVLREEHLIINTTTGNAESSQPQTIEAMIGGSSAMLRDGNALLFLGGDPALIARVQPILDALSSRSFRLGDLGAGARFKLVHNMAIGLNRAVAAETLRFAEAMGFEPKLALEILVQSPASSAAMEAKGPKMVAAAYEPPEARLTQHLKDVRLILAAASDVSLAIPLTQAHETLLERAEARGYGGADNAAVIEAYREQK